MITHKNVKESIVKVKRIDDRITLTKWVPREEVINAISTYAPQV